MPTPDHVDDETICNEAAFDRAAPAPDVMSAEPPTEVISGTGVAPGAPIGMRPPPAGFARRERREWQRLELVRMRRENAQSLRKESAGQGDEQRGFLRIEPNGLDRASRKAWRAAERSATKAWWRQRRATDTDIETRSAGVLVAVGLLGILVLITVLRHHSDTELLPVSGEVAEVELSISLPSALAPTDATTASQPQSVPGVSAIGETSRVGGGSASVAGRWQPVPAGGLDPISAATPTPVDPASVRIESVPTTPATSQDMSTPEGALTVWLTRICPSSWTDPYGADVQRGRSLMTTAGWRVTDPAADPAGAAVWAGVVARRETRVCGDLDVQLSAGSSTAGGIAFVGFTAYRIITGPSQLPAVESVSGVRVLIRQDNGRWLIDVPVQGG